MTEEYDCYFQGDTEGYNLVFHASWSDYEEHGWVFVFEKYGQYYEIEGGYCVMDPHHLPTIWDRDLSPCSADEALQTMLDWEEHEEEFW